MTGIDSYVAIGDSFTEGLMDAHPDGTYRGWADVVAAQLAQHGSGLRYANLAVRGKKLRQIADEQVTAVERLRPALVSVGAGGNDIIRWSADLGEMGRVFDRMMQRLTATGATVLAFTGFDPRRRIPFTGIPGRRADVYNELIRLSTARHGALLVDLWPLEPLYEDRMWAPDRLHLSEAGHRLIAAEVLQVIGVPAKYDDLDGGRAPVAPSGRFDGAIEHARWFARDVLPWAYRGARGRSSGDGRDPKHPHYVRIDAPS